MNKRFGSVQIESEVFQSPVQHLASPLQFILKKENEEKQINMGNIHPCNTGQDARKISKIISNKKGHKE